MTDEIIYREIDADTLFLWYEERSFFEADRDIKRSAYKEILQSTKGRMAAVKVPVAVSDGTVYLGDIALESRDLAHAIGDSREAFVFAVTLGHETDRIIDRYSKLPSNAAKAFLCDKIASDFCETGANIAQDMLSQIAKTKKRFSVGYGDLSLSQQPKILKMLNAERLLGITLTDGMLMKPSKTITAISGIKNEE